MKITAGRLATLAILAVALVAGAALYYVQVYAYYREVPPSGPEDVMLTLAASGDVVPLEHSEFRAIDADSSPIRYRACFRTPLRQEELTETFEILELAEPRVAPGWFDCFDAEQIGADLEAGRALAFLGERNVRWGVDRIVAIYPDGRGYAWHRLNDCGEKEYDGSPVTEDCPPRPEDAGN